jgi:hypothetical protein
VWNRKRHTISYYPNDNTTQNGFLYCGRVRDGDEAETCLAALAVIKEGVFKDSGGGTE